MGIGWQQSRYRSLPFGMLKDRDHQLNRRRARDRRDARASDGAHLVQRPVRQGLQHHTQRQQAGKCRSLRECVSTHVHRCHDIVAVVAPQPARVRLTRLDRHWRWRRLARGRRDPMPHHQERVKPKRDVHHKLREHIESRQLQVAWVGIELIRLTLRLAAPITVGSHLLSRESIRRYTTSCSSINFSSAATSAFAFSTFAGGIGCPGIGIDSVTPVASCERNAPVRQSKLGSVLFSRATSDSQLQGRFSSDWPQQPPPSACHRPSYPQTQTTAA